MSKKLTPWFPSWSYPKRPGIYRVQDSSFQCDCCWFEAHWDGLDWHTDLLTPGKFRTLELRALRWRGLAKKP